MMNLYQYKLKHSLDKLDKREDEVIYRANLYELSEKAMLNNLISSKGKSPLLITNGSYIDESGVDNNYSFYHQYSTVKRDWSSKANLYYIAYQTPFSNLNAIEIYSKINLPIVIDRRIEYTEGDTIVFGSGYQPYIPFLILNAYQVPPLVFVIKADAIHIGVTKKYRQLDYMIKKYSTIDLIESLQSQEVTYKEIKDYLSFGGSCINIIEQLQQKKQNQIEQAYKNYEIYLQKHNEELLLKSLEEDQERNNINNLVKTLRKSSK